MTWFMKNFEMRSAVLPDNGGGYISCSGGIEIEEAGCAILGMEKCVFCSKQVFWNFGGKCGDWLMLHLAASFAN